MKKLFVFFASGLFSLTAMAQQSSLIGTWQQLDNNGNPTTNVKIFMPDGKLLGQSFNDDFTASSVWFMSNYKVLNDTSYVDHEFYHSNINYQRDYFFTFHKESDSVLVTSYIDYRNSALGSAIIERWKKMDSTLPVFTDAEWEALHQKSLVEFDRLPKEGQTVQQYADALYKDFERYKSQNNQVRANEALLMRAELDTMNLAWQRDVILFYMEAKIIPACADKYAARSIRVAEQLAPTPTDTTVVNTYSWVGLLYLNGSTISPEYAEKSKSAFEKALELQKMSGRQFTAPDANRLMSLAFLAGASQNKEKCLEYLNQSIEIYESDPQTLVKQKADAYMFKGMTLAEMDKYQEAIDILLKAVPLSIDEQGNDLPKNTAEIYPQIFKYYGFLLADNPKDKKVAKAFQQFMEDKLPVGEIYKKNDYNLLGEYYIVEINNWTVEKPGAVGEKNHFVFQKDGNHTVVEPKEGEELGCSLSVKKVDAATKKDIIKQWKAFKKGKK